ncbi:hypothetical protein BT63DRAFT_261412 [Microthyrium microscopicum]|uniref:F-box domain-containing protein n=1 Tax=Microthyrium microscopicum TaxID=703497 RepID=A0A6A6UEZ9_9PEZI|nr:hypothetical protein BT63DRAFT_261412 [Microthyrium microscopicum]
MPQDLEASSGSQELIARPTTQPPNAWIFRLPDELLLWIVTFVTTTPSNSSRSLRTTDSWDDVHTSCDWRTRTCDCDKYKKSAAFVLARVCKRFYSLTIPMIYNSFRFHIMGEFQAPAWINRQKCNLASLNAFCRVLRLDFDAGPPREPLERDGRLSTVEAAHFLQFLGSFERLECLSVMWDFDFNNAESYAQHLRTGCLMLEQMFRIMPALKHLDLIWYGESFIPGSFKNLQRAMNVLKFDQLQHFTMGCTTMGFAGPSENSGVDDNTIRAWNESIANLVSGQKGSLTKLILAGGFATFHDLLPDPNPLIFYQSLHTIIISWEVLVNWSDELTPVRSLVRLTTFF